ncbi:Interactor of constitutive active ROPs 3 [Sesamum alatum]|uniref:Interactor of constitutive active ROPs 3 n=1 Tax=Sesamum alatum TaxID=300844 RepID=A0AAE2D043_9LAMI|nr:Interactor of constitutive active ROPs 3 [Sesamum alatum]
MKNELRHSKKPEDQAQELVGETLMQLETARKTVEMLRSGGCKATEAYDAIAFELGQSRARVKFLEELVCKLKADIDSAGCEKDSETKATESIEMDFTSVKLEVERLRSALQVAEIRSNEEQRNAFEMVERIKSASGQREAELEAELRKSRYEIEELKVSLKDKETELRGILEENDDLIMRLESTLSGRRERKLEKELQRSWAEVQYLKGRFIDRETEWRNVSEENEKLKLQIKQVSEEIEAGRAAEREALMKVGLMAEEVDKSKKKTARVAEELEAAQAGNAEMEAELRRLKVQSDQCRKAAEAAASMLLAGSNGQLVERTGSMDRIYGPWTRTRRISLAYADEADEDLVKKKNGNMLSRFGVLWKKSQK